MLPISSINKLAKEYNVLELYPKTLALAAKYFPDLNLAEYSKHQLHQFINDAIMESYQGESVLKYELSRSFLPQHKTVGAFEINVNSSRLDFLTINQTTTSYEIKSELDSIQKLSKQMADYASVFEYNYLAVAERHLPQVLKKALPEFGLMVYSKGQGFTKIKEALLCKPNPAIQLANLTKAERRKYFKVPSADIEEILLLATPELINTQFKSALIKRYKNKWKFLINNQESIMPVDYQFFFKMDVKPENIYNY